MRSRQPLLVSSLKPLVLCDDGSCTASSSNVSPCTTSPPYNTRDAGQSVTSRQHREEDGEPILLDEVLDSLCRVGLVPAIR